MRYCIIYNEDWEREVLPDRVDELYQEIKSMQNRLSFTCSSLKITKLQFRIEKYILEKGTLYDRLHSPPQICIIDGGKWS